LCAGESNVAAADARARVVDGIERTVVE